MKKLFYLLTGLLFVVSSCDIDEELNDELLSSEEVIIGTETYTLTDDDYNDLDLSFGSFNSEDEAKLLLPPFLADKYPFWGEGSAITVNYKLFRGSAEGVSDFTSSDIYTLSNDDYAAAGSDAFGFYPDTYTTDKIADILSNQIDGAVDGQLVLAKYEQYIDDPEVGLANLYLAQFPADYSNFELESVSGRDDLGWTEGSGYVNGSGFDSGANAVEEWLISPEIDLTNEEDLFLQVTQEIDFLGDESLIDILVSTDYTTDGDVTAATWTAIDFDKTAYSDMTASEDWDFSDYEGETIHIALKYSSTDSDSPRWRVQSLAVKTLGVSGETDSKGDYFMFDGTDWEEVEDVYFLSSEDFDSMGEEFGQPGRFDNFSSSVNPNNYLPQFLAIKYPYAQEDDSLFVIYDYFSSSSGAQRRGNFYTYNGSEWVGFESTISTSLQFGFENGEWVPDNTIRYSLVGSDYAIIVNQLAGVAGFEAAVDNLDSFGNFNRTAGSTNWSDEMILTALNFVLDSINPNAEDGQKYIVTIATWAPGNSTEDLALIKSGGEWVYQE